MSPDQQPVQYVFHTLANDTDCSHPILASCIIVLFTRWIVYMRQLFITAVAISLLLMGACGQTGPLYPADESRPENSQASTP